MDKRNFISVTLLISALALNPLSAVEFDTNEPSSQRQVNTLTNSIASVLYKKGLDEDAAHALSKDLVNDNDEEMDMMIHNFASIFNDISHEKIHTHLSGIALYRQNIDLASYDNLVHMASKIKGKSLTESELKQLNRVAKCNQTLTA